MPAPIVNFGYTYYLRRRASTAPTWAQLSQAEQDAETGAARWMLDTAHGSDGNGVIYSAGPTDPVPTQPPT